MNGPDLGATAQATGVVCLLLILGRIAGAVVHRLGRRTEKKAALRRNRRGDPIGAPELRAALRRRGGR